MVARRFCLCWRGFATPPILRHCLWRNGGVAVHATVTPNVGGRVMVPHHCICAFGGVRAQATFVCLFSLTFWFPTDNISIFQARQTNTKI
jgi:hypothetical protein